MDDSQSRGFSYSGSGSKSGRRTSLTAQGERGSCTGHAFHSEHPGGGDSISNKRNQGSLEETHIFLLSVLGGVLAWRVWRGLWVTDGRYQLIQHIFTESLRSVQPSASCSLPSAASLPPGAVELITLESEPTEMWVWSRDVPQMASFSLDCFPSFLTAESVMFHPWEASV